MESRFNKNYQVYRKYLNQIVVMYQKRNDLRLFLETLLTMTAVVFFGLFAVKPTLVTVAELYRGKQAKEETLNTLNIKIENLIEAEKLYNQFEEEIVLLNKSIPSDPVVEEVVRQIEGAANTNNTLLLSFDLGQVIIKGQEPNANTQALPAEDMVEENGAQVQVVSQEITFDLSATGSFTELNAFLRDLETLRRPINFTEIDFRKPPSGVESLGELLLNVKGSLAYRSNQNE